MTHSFPTRRSSDLFRWVKGHAGDPMNDLVDRLAVEAATSQTGRTGVGEPEDLGPADALPRGAAASGRDRRLPDRSEEHTSELQSLMRISYAVFCLKQKKHKYSIQQSKECNR